MTSETQTEERIDEFARLLAETGAGFFHGFALAVLTSRLNHRGVNIGMGATANPGGVPTEALGELTARLSETVETWLTERGYEVSDG